MEAHKANLAVVPFILVAYNESGLNPEATGDHGLAHGLWQFHERTFNAFKKEAEMPYLKYHSYKDQTTLFVWAIKNGKDEHWPTVKRTMNEIKFSVEGI